MSLTGQVLRVHQWLYIRSGGRVGHHMLGVPCLLLGTTGRRSGKPRTNSLVYAQEGDDYLVVASNGGADNAPGWFHNLKADPDVRVKLGTHETPARARVIEQSDSDYDRVWKIVNANNRDRYSGYQKMTSRPIPVVAISPGP